MLQKRRLFSGARSSTPHVLAAFAAFVLAGAPLAAPPPEAPPAVDPAVLDRIRDAAMASDWAWQRLADLTDKIGPRLSGSPQDPAAVAQVAAALRATGAKVRLQPVKVPHWVRGAESAELVAYPGQPAGLRLGLHLTALGASGATPAQGITAHVVVIHDFAELQARAAEVRGNIVYFAAKFDQALALGGFAGQAYGQAGAFRFVGPDAAAKLGAAAALLRSVGGADYRLPHTGVTIWRDGQAPIAAAALAAEDGDLIVRLAAQGPVDMKLVLTPQTLPDADGNNVIADWPGREEPDEVVVVSGHLDSWDLGTGASDDGTGVAAAAGVIEVLRQLDLHPRRTIRFIAWANEENGGRGGKGYAESVAASLGQQTAAIESDGGAGHAMGISAAVARESMARLKPLSAVLQAVGAGVLRRDESARGADIAPLQKGGVPGFSPLVDDSHYFDYHHTAADTLDKVDPKSLRTQVAVLAVLAYYLADLPEALPRFTPPED
jgi:hypothetical protein